MQRVKYVAVIYGRGANGRFVRLGYVKHIRRLPYLFGWLTRSYKFSSWTRAYVYEQESGRFVQQFDR